MQSLNMIASRRGERLVVYWPFMPVDSVGELDEFITDLNGLDVLTVTAQNTEYCESAEAEIYRQKTISVSTVGWNLQATDASFAKTNVVGYGVNVFAPTSPVGYSYSHGPAAAMAYTCGIAALVWSEAPSISSKKLKKHLENSAMKIRKECGRLLRYSPL